MDAQGRRAYAAVHAGRRIRIAAKADAERQADQETDNQRGENRAHGCASGNVPIQRCRPITCSRMAWQVV